MIRNFIEVSGIASENDLPEKSFGQLIKYSEIENLFIPEDKIGLKEIYQIAINIEAQPKRTIKHNGRMTIVLDGIKKFKIVYSEEQSPDKLVMLNLRQPYNTFFEAPLAAGEIDNIHIHILDAYFEVLDKRKIYAHFVYLLDVRYTILGIEPISRKNAVMVDLLSAEEIKKCSESQIALSQKDFVLLDENFANKKETLREDNEYEYIDDMACLYL